MDLDRKITEYLLPWYEEHKRPLPWRRDRLPYHIWVSEIMCQQTRVEAVKAYYLRFLEALPDIEDLAACPEETLQKLWEGLGYYSRARNLQRSARLICRDYCGRFPSTYEEIRALPGIGDYTAAAIASICFGLPAPAVDGNVLRLSARLAASRMDITKEATKREFREALRPLFEGADPGELNQALMELGAMVCLPNRAPDCAACPLRSLCASSEGAWREIPVKSPKKTRRTEAHTVFLLGCNGRFALNRRPDSGLLAGLWEFPSLPGRLGAQEALDAAESWGCLPRKILRQTGRTHIFTHITWELTAYLIVCGEHSDAFTWADAAEIRSRYPLPTAFRQFLNDLDEKKGE